MESLLKHLYKNLNSAGFEMRKCAKARQDLQSKTFCGYYNNKSGKSQGRGDLMRRQDADAEKTAFVIKIGAPSCFLE